jgi:DNA-binding HxlR family transcriptional regulator
MSSSGKKYSMDNLLEVSKVAKIIGSKWTIQILNSLLSGTKRFGEIEKSLKNINPKTLSKRLQTLEKEGYIIRKAYPEVPPRVEYTLTEKGKIFKSVIKAVKTCEEKI